MSGDVEPDADNINQLLYNTKYLVFNWISGGNFFPSNPIQFIRPAESALAIVEAYKNLNGQGALTAIGCTQEITVLEDRQVDFIIRLEVL